LEKVLFRWSGGGRAENSWGVHTRATTPFGNFILANPRATSENFAFWRKKKLEKK